MWFECKRVFSGGSLQRASTGDSKFGQKLSGTSGQGRSSAGPPAECGGEVRPRMCRGKASSEDRTRQTAGTGGEVR